MTAVIHRTAATNLAARAAADILTDGYARTTLPAGDAANLRCAIATANTFFSRPLADKMRHGSADHNYGYRPYGIEYSRTPERPDMNECFTLWSSRLDLIPNADTIAGLTAAFLAWRNSLAPLVTDTLNELARHFGADAAPRFDKASHLQMNYCLPAPAARDMLQDRHEDGHMVTVIHATAPGLEVYLDDTATPILPGPDEVLIMPGSVLTALTVGAIQPLYHQVRNHGLDDRQSLMYFVNPEIDNPLWGWVPNTAGARTDIRDHVQNAPTMFGLPPVEAL